MSHVDRALNAWRAYFFLLAWKQDMERLRAQHPLFINQASSLSPVAWVIMERVATSLILLIETYAQYHPNTPLQPWNLTTRSLEHWFGEGRQLFGTDFTLSELLMGSRTQDLRSTIFHSGDVNLRGQRERKSKAGYQFRDEPLSKSSTSWNMLATYPNPEDRSTRIPLAAFTQASLLLEHLGMPMPQTPRRDLTFNDGLKGRLAVQTLVSGIISTSNDSDDETEDFKDTDSDLEHDFEDVVVTRTRPNLRLAVSIAGNETANRSRFVSRIESLEKEAEETLNTIKNTNPLLDRAMPEPSFMPQDDEMYPADLDPASALTGVNGALDVNKVVGLRNRHDPPARLNSEKSKASIATFGSQQPEDAPEPKVASSYLRQRRDIINNVTERETRPRTLNNRQARWENRRRHIVKAYQSSSEHFVGKSILSSSIHVLSFANSVMSLL
jgi:hypothetical protein